MTLTIRQLWPLLVLFNCILYFACCFGTLLTEKFLVKRFPTTKEDLLKYNFDESEGQITEAQKRGLKWAVIGLVIFVIALVAACIGDDPLLADPKTHSVMTNGSPFMNGIILTVTVALFVVGACYGFGCGKYKNDRDLFADITLGFKDMAGYIFMCFFIAQFTSYFAWSNLGIVMAIKGAEALKAMEFTGAPLLIGLIFVSCLVNILIGSASANGQFWRRFLCRC